MRVSIVICNYNYEAFVGRAIETALAQDHPDMQVIVVDDGSTDASRAVFARFGDAIEVVLKENGGQASAYNAGFERATGDVVLFLDADDLLDEGACSQVVRAFEADPHAAKVHFRLRIIDADGVPLGPVIPSRLAEGDLSEAIRVWGELYDSAPASGNAYRASLLRRLMPLVVDASDRVGADLFLVYGVALLGRVRIAGDAPLGAYRLHRAGTIGGLAFGNVGQDEREAARSYARHEQMRAWIVDRLGPGFAVAPARLNFSIEKHGYVDAIFASSSYAEGVRSGARLLCSRMLPAIRDAKGSWARRAALGFWAVGVLVLPRSTGRPIARYVCNPASR